MMECPRCGFTQPKDRYCANCGLDSENYEPKRESVGQTVLKSPLLYVAGAAVIVILLGLFFSKAKQASDEVSLTETDSSFSNSAPEAEAPIETSASDLENPRAEASSARLAERAPPPETAPSAPSTESFSPQTAAPTNSQTFVNPDSQVQDTDEGASTLAAGAATIPTQIQIQFYEFPRAALATALTESRVISDADQYRILLHMKQEELNTWLRSGRRLPGSRSGPIREDASLVTNFEVPPPAAVAGEPSPPRIISALSVDTMISQILPSGEVNIDVRGAAISQNPVRFATNQTLSSATSLLIFGVLPHIDNTESTDFPNGTPLVILESPDFQDNLSEFVIVIQVR